MEENQSKISRRNFIKNTSGALAAATIAAPLYVPQKVFGSNDTIRAAVLGVNGRGKGHIKSLMNLENVEESIGNLKALYEGLDEETQGSILEQIGDLEAARAQLQEDLENSKKGFSLLGWLNKFLVK